MPLKTNVGVSRKVSDNSYGSRGASVNLEVELDTGLIQQPDRFMERVRQVFRLAQQAVDEELNRQQTGPTGTNYASNGTANGAGNGTNGNGAGNGHTNGNGSSANGNGHRNGQGGNPASEKQLDYAKQLAKQINGLGIRRLESLCQKMHGKPLAGLTTMDASGLIDTLKALKEGRMDLNAVLGSEVV